MKKRQKRLISCLVILAILAGGVFGAIRYMHSLSPRQVMTPSRGVTVHVEELSFFSGGEKIYGKVYKPVDSLKKSYPLLIYCHGLGQLSDEAKNICTQAATLGYIAYAFDFRGGATDSRSDGDMLNMSLKTEIKDLEEVLKRMRKYDKVDHHRIFLCGHSMGSAVAGIVAGEHPSLVEGAVLLSPAFNLPDMTKEQYPKIGRIPQSTQFLSWTVGRHFFSDIHSMNPYRNLDKFKGDVLIIHGEDDDLVPQKYAVKAAATFPNAELRLLPGVGHVYKGDASKKMHELLGEYLSAHNAQ